MKITKSVAAVGVLMATIIGGCTMSDDTPPAGAWHVDYIEGQGVIDYSPAHYQFGEDNRLSGNSTCNQFSGEYTLENGKITVGNLAGTRKMCPPAMMEQEQRFLAALQKADHWKTDNGLMYLYDVNGVELFRGAAWIEPEGQ